MSSEYIHENEGGEYLIGEIASFLVTDIQPSLNKYFLFYFYQNNYSNFTANSYVDNSTNSVPHPLKSSH